MTSKNSSQSSRSRKLAVGIAFVVVGLIVMATSRGCIRRNGRSQTAINAQRIEDNKTKTDSLRKAMRFLGQMTPLTRDNYIKEIQLELNSWLKDADRSNVQFSPSPLLQSLPNDLLTRLGADNPVQLRFGYWDIDYLFGRRIMNDLADWIVDFPLRDSLQQRILDTYKSKLTAEQVLQLTDACKLFDWTTRNVTLSPNQVSVEQMSSNPQELGGDAPQIGYGYLPWETLLFSVGDFVERGRVFCALAEQRGLDTFWIAVGAQNSQPGKLWAIGVAVGDEIYIFEPKLGMPVLDPDNPAFATLGDAKENERVLRRLDLPGQFDYALNPGELQGLKFLIDVEPMTASIRMQLLEKQLLSDERMILYRDLDQLASRLSKLEPDAKVELWQLPLFAQVTAAGTREMLQTTSPASMQYMAAHGVWLLENPAGIGRFKHLQGSFENSDDKQGALDLYMESRIDDERIEKLSYDPDVQRELGFKRQLGQTQEAFELQVRQAQMIFGRAKVDAAYLLAALHFDRGNFEASKGFLEKRVLPDSRAAQWHAAGNYLLARIFQEAGQLEEAEEALTTIPSPMEAGNRIRLRYLRRLLEE